MQGNNKYYGLVTIIKITLGPSKLVSAHFLDVIKADTNSVTPCYFTGRLNFGLCKRSTDSFYDTNKYVIQISYYSKKITPNKPLTFRPINIINQLKHIQRASIASVECYVTRFYRIECNNFQSTYPLS